MGSAPKASADEAVNERLVTQSATAEAKRWRELNDALPDIEVDSETYEVRADGELLTCPPADVLPMAQRYFLF